MFPIVLKNEILQELTLSATYNIIIANVKGGLEMNFAIKVKNGQKRLYKEGFIDADLGRLYKTYGARLETNNLLSENFTLDDLSGFFANGQKYKITSTKGLKGTLTKMPFSNSYKFVEDVEE